MSEQFKMVPASLLERLLDDPAMVVRMPSDSIVAIKTALSAPAGDVDFWDWLDRAYRNGSQGDQPKFTKYNMEVAFTAGISAAEKNVEPVPPAGDVPEYFVAACDKFDWTPEEALRFYAEGKHFDTVDGRTRILCTGAIASHALKGLEGEYADMKGVELASDAEELENLRHWRDLALQFDNHRLQALWHLKTLLQSQEHAGTAHEFLEAPPMAAHEVTAERDGLRNRLESARARFSGWNSRLIESLREERANVTRLQTLLDASEHVQEHLSQQIDIERIGRQSTDENVTRLTADLSSCSTMAAMIEEREWADHVGSGPVSSKVESAITQLHNDLHEAQDELTKARELSGLSAEAFSVLQGMVEHCLNVRACMGMDEGYKDFLNEEDEHEFVKELRAFIAQNVDESCGQDAEAAKREPAVDCSDCPIITDGCRGTCMKAPAAKGGA